MVVLLERLLMAYRFLLSIPVSITTKVLWIVGPDSVWLGIPTCDSRKVVESMRFNYPSRHDYVAPTGALVNF